MAEDYQTPPAPPAAQEVPPEGAPLKPHRGVTVLVLGILGLVCCVICGIIAWVMGSSDLKEMKAGIMNAEGRGMTQAGMICGIISVILNILMIILQIAGFGILSFFAASQSASTY